MSKKNRNNAPHEELSPLADEGVVYAADNAVDELLDDAEEGTTTDAAEVAVAAPKVAARLCKGQMPSPLVWFIKFCEPQDNRSAIAAKYFTTAGKINDIQTDANQKYIVKNMVFTADELDQAAAKIRENFIRGQAEVAAGRTVSPRQLSTAVAGDEAYALSVIEGMRNIAGPDGAVTLVQARAAHSITNPRAARKPAETADAAAAESEVDELMGEGDDGVGDDDLSSLLEE